MRPLRPALAAPRPAGFAALLLRLQQGPPEARRPLLQVVLRLTARRQDQPQLLRSGVVQALLALYKGGHGPAVTSVVSKALENLSQPATSILERSVSERDRKLGPGGGSSGSGGPEAAGAAAAQEAGAEGARGQQQEAPAPAAQAAGAGVAGTAGAASAAPECGLARGLSGQLQESVVLQQQQQQQQQQSQPPQQQQQQQPRQQPASRLPLSPSMGPAEAQQHAAAPSPRRSLAAAAAPLFCDGGPGVSDRSATPSRLPRTSAVAAAAEGASSRTQGGGSAGGVTGAARQERGPSPNRSAASPSKGEPAAASNNKQAELTPHGCLNPILSPAAPSGFAAPAPRCRPLYHFRLLQGRPR
jgi:hypothetical protein